MSLNFDNLSGKFLVASPYSGLTDSFNKSLIYIASHSDQGSVGMIVNRVINRMPFQAMMKLLQGDDSTSEFIVPIYLGGPVEPERGFILHTTEYDKNLLLKFSNNLAVSSNLEILRDIAKGTGPANSLFVLGYTGWNAGQLESEISSNFWLVADYDKDLMFDSIDEKKWDIALSRLGIDNTLFAPGMGHC
ncbi:MAG: YqgE/AlgH family protein [Pseudomonadota bacterium]